MKRVVRRKRLVLKQWVQEWLAAHLFVGMVYTAMFAWLFDSRRLGVIFAFGLMGAMVVLEILVKILKEISKKVLTKLN